MNLDFIEILKTYPRHSQDPNPPAGGANDEGYASSPGSPDFVQFDGTPWFNAWHRHQDGTYAKGFAADHTRGDENQWETVLTIAPPPPPNTNDQSGNTTGTTTGAVTAGNTPPPKVTSPIGISTVPTADDSNVPSQGPPPPDPPPPPPPDLDSDLVVEYNSKGLLWKSTNALMGKRDLAGNLIYFSSGSENPILTPGQSGVVFNRTNKGGSLLLEGVKENIDRESYMETVKTRFEYFKFPATTKVNEFITIPELDAITLDLETADERMFIRLKPSENWPIQVINSVQQAELDATAAGASSEEYIRSRVSGTLIDELIDGDLQYQSGNTGIIITPEFKASGADLRIQLKVTHNYSGGGAGTCWFSLIKFSPGGVFRNFKPLYERKHGPDIDTLLRPTSTNTTFDATVNQYTGTASSTDGGYLQYSQIDSGKQKMLFAEFVLSNAEFQAYDRFAIGALAQQSGHVVQSVNTYMIAADASRMESPDGQNMALWRQMGNKFYNSIGAIIG
jgi:hypothetical protein